MIHELLPDMKKVIKILRVHRLITKAQRMQMNMMEHAKATKHIKVLCTTAKLIHELLPNMIKVIKILRDTAGTHTMIRLLPERYDLNRPLVGLKGFEMVQCKGLKWSPKVFRVLVEAVP